MKKNFTFLSAFLCFVLMGNAQDSCSSAIELTLNETCQEIVIDNTDFTASNDGPDPICGLFGDGIDAWFTVEVPASGTIIAQTVFVDNGLFDMVMQSYTGSCNNLTLLQCNDDSGAGNQSLLVLDGLTPGSTVYLRVFEYSSNAFGEFGICALAPDYGVGDNCANSVNLPVGTSCSITQVNNTDGVPSYNGFGCVALGSIDYWFDLEVPAEGNVTIETRDINNGLTDMTMAVYTGSCTGLFQLECDFDGGDGFQSKITLLDRTPGETIFVQVASWDGQPGDFGICAYSVDYQDSDICSNAIELPVGDQCTYQTFTNVGYNFSDITPFFTCGINGGADVWFTATIPASGRVTVSTEEVSGGLDDLVVQIYEGSCEFLNSVICKNDEDDSEHPSLTIGSTPGNTIYIRVAADDLDAEGEFNICVFEAEPAEGDVCLDATQISALETCIPRVFSNEGLSNSGDGFDFTCGFEGVGNDHWFFVTIPPSGNLIIETTDVEGSDVFDKVLQVYSGECGNLEIIECDDDGGVFNNSLVEIIGRTPGEVIYFEVIEYGSNSLGEFGVCAYDASAVDGDGDGWNSFDDCDDTEDDIYPGAPEIAGNEIDEDCDGEDLSSTYDLLNGSISIYPNPTNGILYVDNPDQMDLHFVLFNAEGKKLMENTLSESINLSDFVTGMYLFHLVNKETNERVIERIVLSK